MTIYDDNVRGQVDGDCAASPVEQRDVYSRFSKIHLHQILQWFLVRIPIQNLFREYEKYEDRQCWAQNVKKYYRTGF